MTEQLSFKEFTDLALRTESKIDGASFNYPAFIALLDLFITVGTFLDYTKKGMFYNNYTKYDEQYKELLHKLHSGMLTLQNAESEGERVLSTEYNFRVIHGLLGAVTEASELCEHLKSYMLNGKVDTAGIAEEFSDGDWYKAIMFDELGVDEQTARRNVINKLKVRYPEKYSDVSALNRDIATERKELEQNM